MNTIHTALAKAAAIAVLASFAGVAGAAGLDQTINVSATVNSVCKLNAGAMTMTFAAIDPSSPTDVTKDTVVSYKCTKGVTPVITATPTTGLLGTMAYSVAVGTPQVGQGFSTDSTATITGTIPQTSFVDSAAGTFTDSVTVHINN